MQGSVSQGFERGSGERLVCLCVVCLLRPDKLKWVVGEGFYVPVYSLSPGILKEAPGEGTQWSLSRVWGKLMHK